MLLLSCRFFKTLILLPILCAHGQLYGAVVDLAPGDLYAPKVDFNVVSITHSKSQYNGLFSYGISNETKRLKVQETNTNITKFSSPTESIPGYFLSAGISKLYLDDTASSTSASGVGDLQLGAGLWPYFNPATGESFGLGISSTIPTGSYDSRKTLNPGQNRNRYNVLARYVSPKVNGFWFDASIQKNWLTENKNYLGNTLKTDPGHSITIFVARQLEKYQTIYTGYEINDGGNSYINSTEVSQGQNDARIHIGFRKPISNKTELTIRSSKSVDVQHGYDQCMRLSIGLNYRF